METTNISFESTGFFSRLLLDYLDGKESVRHFYKYVPDYASFPLIIEEKNMQPVNRQLLTKVLNEQYSGISASKKVTGNIQHLEKENTFTITTAHQPVIFGGPLYMPVKIICTINMCRKLKQQYPDFNFVPVFWLGSEDHDFAEISQTCLFGNKIEWKSEPEGATGKMDPRRMKKVFPELQEILSGNENGDKLLEIFRKAYLGHETLSLATRYLFNELFGEDGLVIIDGDNRELKKEFIPEMEEEILKMNSRDLVGETNKKIAENYAAQAFARPINLFYMKPGFRERIEYNAENQSYEVLNAHLYFDMDSIKEELYNYPERFSPNVILRPLYQEKILPNLAYIGGGGEISYWLQLEKVFEHYRINFPMLVVRNSVIWVDTVSRKRMEGFDLKVPDLFRNPDEVINDYVLKQSNGEITLEEEKNEMEKIYENIKGKAIDIDPTLKKTVMAEAQRAINSLEKIEAKIVKAEKRKNDTAVNQIRKIYTKVFPGNELIERKENFSSFYVKQGEEFFNLLRKELQPLEQEVLVVKE